MKRVISTDETSIYTYNLETTNQVNIVLKEQQYPKNRSKIAQKSFKNHWYRGMVHYEFLPRDQTLKKEYWLNVMHYVCVAIPQKKANL